MFETTNERGGREISEVRQWLTILFSDLSNSTHLAGHLEAEVNADLMHDLREAFGAAVRTRGGVVNQFQGDALQAVFGHPRSTEHDARLAVEAALDVHRRVRSLRDRYSPHGAGQLSVHSGIHAGLVLVRPGVEGGSRVELSGALPGVAKHLSDVAADDELLVSDEALGPLGHLFETMACEPVALKGRELPLPVCRVLGSTALRTRFQAHVRRGLLPFIGREPERARLDAALADAAAGRGRFVLLRGAPGLGKTRLAEEFLRQAEERGFGVARGDSDGSLRGEPLQPFVQMLRARIGVAPQLAGDAAAQLVRQELEAIDPALVERVSDVLRVLSLEPADGRDPNAAQRTADALRDVFAAIAKRQPQVLFLDDWQWADDATRRVVHALVAAKGLPLLMLGAARPAESGEITMSDVDVIDLAPLGEAQTAASIAALMPGADPFVVQQVGKLSGGNPLFVEELCHFAARPVGQSLWPVQAGPAWLETLIESRVAKLPDDQRAVLEAAAVIGNSVPGWLLEKVTGHAVADAAMQALERHDLLVPSEDARGLRFKHGITRDVVYASIGRQARRDIHQRVADLLRAESDASLAVSAGALAYHCAGAGDVAAAARFAVQAGDRAMAASTPDRAKKHYRDALELLDRLPADAERYRAWRPLVRKLGVACVYDPSRDELPFFERAAREAVAHGDAAGRAYAEYWWAYVAYSLGDALAAQAHGQRALGLAHEAGDAFLERQAQIVQAQILAASARYDEALPLLADLDHLQAALTKRAGDAAPPAFAYAFAVKGSMLGDRGRFDEAQPSFDAALAALPRKAHEVEASILSLRACVALWQGRFADAHRHAADARRVAEQVRSLYLYAMALGLGGYAQWRLETDEPPSSLALAGFRGAAAAASERPGVAAGPTTLRQLEQATRWLEHRGKLLFVSLNFGWLTEVLVANGRIDDARRHAAKALRRAREGDWLGAPMAMRALARAAAEQGDIGRARAHLRIAQIAAARRASPHEAACNAWCRAQVDAAEGRRAEALDALAQAEQAFVTLGMTWHRGQAQRVRQGLGG